MHKVALVGVLAALAACSRGEQQEQPVAAAVATNAAAPAQPVAAPALPAAAPVQEVKTDTGLAAVAGAYRWTSGFGQGVSEAIVSNSRSENLNISVQADSEYNDGTETEGSVYLTVDPALKEGDEFYVLVDDRTFTFVEGVTSGGTATDRRQLADLINTLKVSKAAFVSVEVPSRSYTTAFSTKGMRAALAN